MKNPITAWKRAVWKPRIDWNDYYRHEGRHKPPYWTHGIVDKIEDNCSILDAGCGAGKLTRVLRATKSPKELLGIELSMEGVTLCRQNAPSIRYRHRSLVYDPIPIPHTGSGRTRKCGGKWDYITCTHVLEHLVNPELALKNICSQAKTVILAVPNSVFLKERLLVMLGRTTDPGDHLHFWTMAGFRRFLEHYGYGDNIVYHSAIWFTNWTPWPALFGRDQIVVLNMEKGKGNEKSD